MNKIACHKAAESNIMPLEIALQHGLRIIVIEGWCLPQARCGKPSCPICEAIRRNAGAGAAHFEGIGEATTCPVCSHALTYEHGEAVCKSGMCRGRKVEGCCGD